MIEDTNIWDWLREIMAENDNVAAAADAVADADAGVEDDEDDTTGLSIAGWIVFARGHAYTSYKNVMRWHIASVLR
jgi:hypothetical protein